MTQKDKSLLVLKALLLTEYKGKERVSLKHIIKKIDNAFALANPEVMLNEIAEKVFDRLQNEERRKGNII